MGISGWTYAPWRGAFYPDDLRRSSEAELSYASRCFSTIEINGSFYALQRPESYDKWHRLTPEGFVFALKATRFITHVRRLLEIEKPLANFFASGFLGLEEKLGPILWQFPPNFKYDHDRFERFVDLLPADTEEASHLASRHEAWMTGRSRVRIHAKRKLRHAIEVRNESFRNPRFFRLLRKRGLALVISHSSGKWPYFEEQTASFAYARLHGQGELYSGEYGPALRFWERRIFNWRGQGPRPHDVYIYFDNDAKVKAPFDALALKARLGTRAFFNIDTLRQC